jgi:hypothetical protein
MEPILGEKGYSLDLYEVQYVHMQRDSARDFATGVNRTGKKLVIKTLCPEPLTRWETVLRDFAMNVNGAIEKSSSVNERLL